MVLSDYWHRFLGRIAIFSALALFAVVNCFYYLNYCPCHTENEKEYIESDGWYCMFLGNSEAVVGSLVLLCNAILFYYISRQDRQINESIELSREANAQTKRSVDIMYASERGKLSLSTIKKVKDPHKYGFTITNVGRTPVRIVHVIFQPTSVWHGGPPFTRNWIKHTDLMVDLAGGRSLSSIPLKETFVGTEALIDLSGWFSNPTDPTEIAIHFRWKFVDLMNNIEEVTQTAVFTFANDGFRIDTDAGTKYTDA